MRKQSKHRFFAKTIMSWLFEFVSSWVVRRIYSRSNGRNFLHSMSVGKVRPWVRPQSNLYVTHTPILDNVWDIFPKYPSGQMYRFYIELRRKLLLWSNFVDNVMMYSATEHVNLQYGTPSVNPVWTLFTRLLRRGSEGYDELVRQYGSVTVR